MSNPCSRTSVIIPVKNGKQFIAQALGSVLEQLASDDEIIVVNDASTDDTHSVVAALLDPRIFLIEGVGRGVSSARNIGLAAATGEFIAFLDHDDLWPTQRHRIMLQAMLDDSQLDAVFGRIRVQFDQGGTRWEWLLPQDGHHAPGANLGNALYRSVMLRKIEGFDESLHYGEDFDYFFRLQQAGLRYATCDVDGMIYRRHADNASNNQAAMNSMIFNLIRRRRAAERVK